MTSWFLPFKRLLFLAVFITASLSFSNPTLAQNSDLQNDNTTIQTPDTLNAVDPQGYITNSISPAAGSSNSELSGEPTPTGDIDFEPDTTIENFYEAITPLTDLPPSAKDIDGEDNDYNGDFTTQDALENMSVDGVYAENAKDSGEKKGLPQFDPSSFPSQIFWLAIMFVSLYLVFSKKTLPHASSVLENRRSHIQDNLDNAQSLRDQAETVKAEYESMMSEAYEKSSSLFKEIDQDIKTTTAARINAINEKSLKEITEKEANVERAKTEALKDMDQVAAEIAARAAEMLVGLTTKTEDAQKIIANLNEPADKQAA